MVEKNQMLRGLPKVDDVMRLVLEENQVDAPLSLIKLAVQREIQLARERILSEASSPFSHGDLMSCIYEEIQRLNRFFLHRVINATGVVLHTNLGRAKLAPEALERVREIGGHYTNLEYDLDTGERGSRYTHVEELLKILTGAEAALVVNNNAASVYLILDSLVKGKKVIVSRGELVEIGGSFRIPEIMKSSGCQLVEVGATNRTRQDDYRANIDEDTGALLKVHTSNYKIIGFSEEVTAEELKEVGAHYGLPLIYDLGAGLFHDLKPYGIDGGPTVQECIRQSADVVCFSGDKLLGGPQAGIIVGKNKYIEPMKANHLLRAFRIDKLSLAALEATLRQYLSPETVCKTIPALKMITEPFESLKRRAHQFLSLLTPQEGMGYEVIPAESPVGGGTLPGVFLPTCALSVQARTMSAEKLEGMMRNHSIPIIARISKGKALLDVRTMEEEDFLQTAMFLNQMGERNGLV